MSYQGLEHALSLERFRTYLGWAEQSRDRALQLYELNTDVSESLYTPLQMLEVALRNRIHSVLSVSIAPGWFRMEGVVGQRSSNDVRVLEGKLRQDRGNITTSDTVAALSLGFWTSLFGRQREDLWQVHLHAIARRDDGKGLTRKAFSGPLNEVRQLRNRVAHHEPIIARDLEAEHARILQLTRWLSTPAAEWASERTRFHESWARRLESSCFMPGGRLAR
ncbi:Abi family protein [Lysobacter sp. GX 14042]|uniref:Abi family protein n=1 Tax=Lysobacter sp. GX 14042 TaxID=2907155 RepID=UPI001F19D11C|nr:Abi family protein [Lysobacter sp. GX 14042]MCE7031188.1 Abi family protein [Lysobacter sp. GX 14042]